MFGATRLKKNLLVLLFSLLLSAVAFAQTAIDGTIRDQKGKPVSGVAVVLERAEGSIADQTTSNAEGHFRFSAVDAGGYSVKTAAPGFYPATYDLVVRARDPLSLSFDLQPKTTVEQSVEVNSKYLTVDPDKTGSSYTFTQQDLDA